MKKNKLYGICQINKCLIHFFDNDVDIYWIAKKFYDKISQFKNKNSIIKYKKKILNIKKIKIKTKKKRKRKK